MSNLGIGKADLMTPEIGIWTTVTDDPTSLPPFETWVVARRNKRRYQAMWGADGKWRFHDLDLALNDSQTAMIPTHWRPI